MKKLVIILAALLIMSLTANILLSFGWSADHLVMRSSVINCKMDPYRDGIFNCSAMTKDGKVFDFRFGLPVNEKEWTLTGTRDLDI